VFLLGEVKISRMKFKVRKIFGGIFILIGFIFVVSSFSGITGYVVFGSGEGFLFSVLGLMFFVGGFVLVMSGLEKKIEIYRDASKKGEDGFYLNDPEGLFGNTGIVGYKEFVEQCKDLKKGSELMEMTREVYLGSLLRIADSEGEYSDIAKKCLDVLNLEYLEEEDLGADLNKEGRRLWDAFRVWDGSLNLKQRRVLKDSGLRYEKGTPHSKIISKYRSIPIANSPSDSVHGGKNIANRIEKLYEEAKLRDQGK
jgi:hypothetical protein